MSGPVLISRGLDQRPSNQKKVFLREIMFSFERSSSKEYGGESKKDTPVPMPLSAAANALSTPPGEYDRKVETQRT